MGREGCRDGVPTCARRCTGVRVLASVVPRGAHLYRLLGSLLGTGGRWPSAENCIGSLARLESATVNSRASAANPREGTVAGAARLTSRYWRKRAVAISWSMVPLSDVGYCVGNGSEDGL